LKIDKEIGALLSENKFEENISDLYTKTNRYQLALEHYKKAMVLKDTLFSIEKNKEITRKEMNFEFEKKENAAKAEQDKKDAVTAEQSRRERVIRYSVIGGLVMMFIIAVIIFRSLRITRKQKHIIELQKGEVEKKNEIIDEQKKVVEEKNKDITDSINYAKRIQKAILPHRRDIWAAFPQSFVLFKPKDIVSGDFYFFHKNDKSIFIAAADCTGHGVPGAFMSMIGSDKLEDAVSESSDTSEILSLLNKGVKTSLKQSEEDVKSTRDGMDIAICSVDTGNRIVKYAGANRPFWLIRKGQTTVEEIKATKKAIGGFTEANQHFDSHEIKLQEGDAFYLSTDGYADTFGKGGKKMMTKQFKEVLISIQDKPMKEQGRYLDEFVENWKAGTEQVDDILVIGVRL
jgi:serine phosphatase RsbU (regulator of sigma subunit)